MKRSVIAAIVFVVVACKPSSGPVDAADSGPLIEAGVAVVDSGCALLEGITQNQTVISICATVEEIASMVGFIAQFLRHGSATDAGACTMLPGTTFCATKSEMGAAIQFVLQKRAARFALDGGAR